LLNQRVRAGEITLESKTSPFRHGLYRGLAQIRNDLFDLVAVEL
jgi:hypothetical protein